MGWVGAKRRHFALIGIHGGFVLLLGVDGDGDLTSEAEAEAAMKHRKLEHVTGDMFVYLKHGGGPEEGEEEEVANDDGGGAGNNDGNNNNATSHPTSDPRALRDRHQNHPPGSRAPRRGNNGDVDGDGDGGGRKIVLETSGREYRLRADKSRVARAWVTALKNAIAATASSSGTGTGSDGGGGRDVASSSPSPSTRISASAESGRGEGGGGGVRATPDVGRRDGGGGGGVSRSDLELDSPPVPSWEMDSPASSHHSPQPPSPGSSWALATYRFERPAYINVRF